MSNLKCGVCGTEFPAINKFHYIGHDLDESNIFDAFDCPECGCQFVAQRRLERLQDEEEVNYFRWPHTSIEFLKVGDRIPTTLKTGEEVVFVVADKYADQCVFGLEDCLGTEYPMNDTNTNAGGWNASKMRKILNTDIWNQLPDDLKACIKLRNIDGENSKLWLFSREEVFGDRCLPYFKRQANRVKGLGKNGETWFWQLRSAYSGDTDYFCGVHDDGYEGKSNASVALGVAFGFVI